MAFKMNGSIRRASSVSDDGCVPRLSVSSNNQTLCCCGSLMLHTLISNHLYPLFPPKKGIPYQLSRPTFSLIGAIASHILIFSLFSSSTKSTPPQPPAFHTVSSSMGHEHFKDPAYA